MQVISRTRENSPSLAPAGLVRRDSWCDADYWLIEISKSHQLSNLRIPHPPATLYGLIGDMPDLERRASGEI